MHNVTKEKDTLLHEDDSLSKNFTQVPNKMLYAYNLTAQAKTLYVILLSYSRQEDRCFPGYATLCEHMGLSEKIVRRHMRELEATRLLSQKRRGLRKTNAYILLSLKNAHLELAPEREREMGPVEEDEEKEEEDFKKTKNLRRAVALKTEREEATCSQRAHGTTRNTSNVDEQTPEQQDANNSSDRTEKIPRRTAKTHQPDLVYIGKPLSQDEINQRKREGKNVSGMTSLSQILAAQRQQLQERKQILSQDETISDATRTTAYDSPSTKNAPMFIRANIGQLSGFLGDELESIPQDINHAAKLYEQSKLSEDEFREVIFDIFRQARSMPDERIKTRRKSDGRPNKMPLFFSMLKDRLGLKQSAS